MRSRDDQVGKYFGNCDRYYFLGDEFGSPTQAACFFIFFLDYDVQKMPFSPIWRGGLYLFCSLLAILAISYLDC
jgi:hypothetical protein